MKTSFFSPPKGLLPRALTALCIGFGCTWPLLQALDLYASASLCAMCCAGVVLLDSLLGCVPRLRGLVSPLLLCLLGYVLWPYRTHIPAITQAQTASGTNTAQHHSS